MHLLSSRLCLSRLIVPNRIFRHEFSNFRLQTWTVVSSPILNSHLPYCTDPTPSFATCSSFLGRWTFANTSGGKSMFANYSSVRQLRTAPWQTHPSAIETSSSPIRYQLRLFADSDRAKPAESKNGDGKKVDDTATGKIDPLLTKDDSELTLAQRFKKMWKQYWYVLLPVHGVTCCAYFGLFYAISASGIDVISFLELIHTPEVLLNKIKHAPQAGHAVVAFALYKIATPLRYMTTLGLTYYAVKTLSRLGYIKPMPSRKQLKAMIDVKRDEFRERRHRWRQERRFLLFKKRHPTASNGHHPHHAHPKRKKDD